MGRKGKVRPDCRKFLRSAGDVITLVAAGLFVHFFCRRETSMAQINIEQKFPHLVPGKKPATLSRVNGCGGAMYGRRDHDPETNTYISTWCISLVFVPVMCLRAFRVADA